MKVTETIALATFSFKQLLSLKTTKNNGGGGGGGGGYYIRIAHNLVIVH